MKFFSASFLLFFLITSKIVVGQNEYSVFHYSGDEGLNQNSVNYILPDKYGYIYIATEGGITRFSGHDFSSLEFDKNFSGLKGISRIHSLFSKNKDTIFAYSSQDFTIATIADNKVVSVEPYNLIKHGLLVWNNVMPFACPSFIKNNFKDDSLIDLIKSRIDLPAGLLTNYSKDTFLITDAHRLIFFADKGICKIIKIPGAEPLQTFKIGTYIVNIDAKDQLNFYLPQGPVKTVELKFSKKYHQIHYYTDLFSANIFILADNELLKLSVSNYKPEIKHILTDNELSKKIILFFWEKDSNTIACATATNGLYLYKKKPFIISEKINEVGKNNFISQPLAPDNKTILANGYKIKNDTIVGKQNIISERTDLAYKDHLGNYWLKRWNEDRLLKFDKNFEHPKIIAEKFPLSFHIYEDNDNRIWIATSLGIAYYSEDHFTWLNFFDKKIQNLKPEEAYFITQDKNYNYWVGTNYGVYELDHKTKKPIKNIEEVKGYATRFIKIDPKDYVTFLITSVVLAASLGYGLRKTKIKKDAELIKELEQEKEYDNYELLQLRKQNKELKEVLHQLIKRNFIGIKTNSTQNNFQEKISSHG